MANTLGSRDMSALSRDRLPLIACVLLAAVAFPPFMNPGWHGDDYNQVFGSPLTPVLPLGEALALGGMGKISPARLLNFPYMGYGGWLLGAWCHTLQALTHLACVALFLRLLTRMGWGARRAAVATVLFGCAPWLSQAVYWWAAASVPMESLLVLGAFHAHLSWRSGGARAPGWLMVSLACQFAARFFYESWLLAPIAIFAIEFVMNRSEGIGWSMNLRRSAWRTAVHAIPYALWAAGFLLVDDSGVRQPSRNFVRFLISLVSVHARMLNWFADIAWRNVLRDGVVELFGGSSFAFVPLMIVMLLLFRHARARTHHDPEPCPSPPDWLSALVLAAGFYWGSRLIFTLGGGIDTHTRHHYGGSMGLAIFAATAWEGLAARSGPVRRTGLALGAALPLLLALASLGIGVHYRETARAEETTYARLLQDARTAPDGTVLVVTGRPTDTRGELEYYEMNEGVWLEFRLRAFVPGIRAYAVQTASIKDGTLRTLVHSRQDWTPPIRKSSYTPVEPKPAKEQMLGGGAYWLELPMERVMLYEWRKGELARIE